MCGIAGIHRRNNAKDPGDLAKMSAALLRGIEPRGRDATGVLCQFDDGDVWMRKDTVPAKKFIRKGRTYARNARTTLLHTRFATKGSPWDLRNAHPLSDSTGTVTVVHNGVLWNDDEVFQAFDELERVSDTDTEAIPALIQLAGWDDAGDALALIEGSMAIAAIHRDKPGELLLAKADNPLYYVVTRNLVVWASSEWAIQEGFKAAGLPIPGRDKILELPEMHLMRVNGKVGEPERFAPDPEPWWKGSRWAGTSYTSYSWDWDDDVDYATVQKNKRGNGRKKGKGSEDTCSAPKPHGGLVTPTQPPLVRGRVQDDPFPPNSVYEDIAIEVLIAQGYTADEAVEQIDRDGWESAGLTMAELDIVADEEGWVFDDEYDASDEDIVWEDDVAVPAAKVPSYAGLTLVGDVAMRALEKARSVTGRDDYLSNLDR